MRVECESCVFYAYDEETGCYSCSSYLDEDEMYRLMSGAGGGCPGYRRDDGEYSVVKKQG